MHWGELSDVSSCGEANAWKELSDASSCGKMNSWNELSDASGCTPVEPGYWAPAGSVEPIECTLDNTKVVLRHQMLVLSLHRQLEFDTCHNKLAFLLHRLFPYQLDALLVVLSAKPDLPK